MKWLVGCSILVLLNACTGHKQLSSARIIKDGTEMLYGEISREQLFFDFPEWQAEYAGYMPEQEVVQAIRNLHFQGEILLFIGTWCNDSKREVPRFFKILDQSGAYHPKKIRIWAVDRTKKLADNHTDMYDILFVPTFIFLDNGREKGRIVESPENRMEDDILILLGKQI